MPPVSAVQAAAGPFEPGLGLEVHVRLATRDELFCRRTNRGAMRS